MYRAVDAETGVLVPAQRADPDHRHICPECGEPALLRRSSIGTWFFTHARRTGKSCSYRAARKRVTAR